MNETEVDLNTVEDFLDKERKKLDEDRKTLDLILTILKDEQQIHSNTLNDGSMQVGCVRNKITREVINPNYLEPSKKCQSYNSRVEKERLAYLFENASNSLHFRVASKTRNDERHELNKENQDPSYTRSRSRILASENETNRTNNNVQNMVRISPTLFGLGEYEERRRVFLEKKKQEYMEYLSNMKTNRMVQRSRSRMNNRDRKNFTPNSGSNEDEKWNYHYTRLQQQNYRQELDKQIEERKKLEDERINEESLECERSQFSDMKLRQNVMKNIEEDFLRRLKVLNDCKHENEAEKKSETELSPSDYLSPSCEDNSSPNRNERVSSNAIHEQNSHESNNHFARQTIETCSIDDVNIYEKMKKELYKRELIKQIEEKRRLEKKKNGSYSNYEKQHEETTEVPLYLRNPFMKQNAESWTIDNLEEYHKMKDMVYKQELDKQIEEKRERERKCKAEAEEADRKLDERLKKDEERTMREKQEKEVNALRNDVFPQAPNESIQKNPAISKFSSKSLVKSRSVSSSDNKFHEKASVKSVSFAPQTYVYSFDIDGNLNNIPESQDITCADNSIIIEAPYVLAAKNISNSININTTDHCDRKRSKSPITPEYLPIPSNISKPLPGIANLPIPSAVSMSEQAIQEYFKTNAFSDLSKIRKMLRDQKTSIN